MIQILHRLGGQARRFIDAQRYRVMGQKPWTAGYRAYHNDFVASVLKTAQQMHAFEGENRPLPKHYGVGLDERVIEYPWVIARLNQASGYLLDAGSTLNKAFILDLDLLQKKRVVIMTLAPEGTLNRNNVSYHYGDLRKTIFTDGIFDEIVCISTLEHIGMDNTQLYTADKTFSEQDAQAYRLVVQEFRRLLKPGGQVLLTVPFGKYENHGWLQQFNYNMVCDITQVFEPRLSSIMVYRYFADGWQLSTPEECAECTYFNIHASDHYLASRQAAAEAIACIQMVK